MRPHTAILGVVLALAATIAPALIAGRHTHRWGATPELKTAAASLDSFPRVVGMWGAVADSDPLPERVCRELGLANDIGRTYRHVESGEEVKLLLMVGTPGPMVRHPPDVCYAMRANQLLGEEYFEVGADPELHRFKVLQYETSNRLGVQEFRVAYSHAADSGWDAPSNPRMKFGASPVLYKVQALSHTEIPQDGDDPLAAFVDDFVRTFSAFRDGASVPQG